MDSDVASLAIRANLSFLPDPLCRSPLLLGPIFLAFPFSSLCYELSFFGAIYRKSKPTRVRV
jgi:hypothetical protein